jgi:O-6-methylguanine DNA methyltransferase
VNKYSFKSKIGIISLFSTNDKIVKIILNSTDFFSNQPSNVMKIAEQEIIEYLDKTRESFTFTYDLEVSSFVGDIMKTMKRIPYGKTFSYSQLAEEAGHKNAVRACGTVCKKNPLPLVFPCHRVIKKNGEIGDFAGGKKLKLVLINLEK